MNLNIEAAAVLGAWALGCRAQAKGSKNVGFCGPTVQFVCFRIYVGPAVNSGV